MNTPTDGQRFDPVTPVHKALRHFMFDVLTLVGAVDVSDIFAVDRCGKQVTRLAAAIPDAAATLAPLVQGLYQRDVALRRTAATVLYRELTVLVTDQLLAQQKLEATRVPLLWAQHTDIELGVLRRKQLSAMSEQELADALRWMGPAVTPQELAAFVTDLQASVAPQTFSCLIDTLRRQLDTARWERVAREIGLPGVAAPATAKSRGGAGIGREHDSRRHEASRRTHRADRHRVRAR